MYNVCLFQEKKSLNFDCSLWLFPNFCFKNENTPDYAHFVSLILMFSWGGNLCTFLAGCHIYGYLSLVLGRLLWPLIIPPNVCTVDGV